MEHEKRAALIQQQPKPVCALRSFAGWKHLHRTGSIQDENPKKTHQLFHSKHGHVRSSISDFPVSTYCDRVVRPFLADRRAFRRSDVQNIFLLYRGFRSCVWWLLIVLELWYFLSVLPLSVLSCVVSLFSPLGSSPSLSSPQNCLPGNLLRMEMGSLVSCDGRTRLKIHFPMKASF